jgi:hypothetical protein
MALFLEESTRHGTKWIDSIDEPLWTQVCLAIGVLLMALFRAGVFAGTMPREAYFVRCDKETTT